MTQRIVTQIHSILEEVLSGKLDPDDAITAWPSVDDEGIPELRRAWEQLQHFAIDSDIRARDEEFAHAQREKLGRCLDDLAALLRRLQ